MSTFEPRPTDVDVPPTQSLPINVSGMQSGDIARVSTVTDRELDRLRERAYGPEAVPLSAVELAQLRRLEQAAKTPTPDDAASSPPETSLAAPSAAALDTRNVEQRPTIPRLSGLTVVLAVAVTSGAAGFVIGSASSESAMRSSDHAITEVNDEVRFPGVSDPCTVTVDVRDGSVTRNDCLDDNQQR